MGERKYVYYLGVADTHIGVGLQEKEFTAQECAEELNKLNDNLTLAEHKIQELKKDLKEIKIAYWDLCYEHRDFCNVIDPILDKYEKEV